MQNATNVDRRVVADCAARALQRAQDITRATERMLYAAGWSRTEVDHFLIGIRDD